MSTVHKLRGLINQRLTAAAEEIFELFERTILEYEEQLCRCKENQHKLLDAVYNPEVRLHRAVYEQLLVRKEEVPPEQQVDSPELLQVKEEQEGPWTVEQLEETGGADVVEFTLIPVAVKSEEDDGEKPQPPQLHDNQTGEPGHTEHLKTEQNFNPDSHFDSVTHQNTFHSSDGERSDFGCVREGTSEPQTSLKPASDTECNTGTKLISSFTCVTDCGPIKQPQTHVRIQPEDKPFPCPFCGKRYPLEKSLKKHMKRHSKEKYFSCSVCKKSFPWRGELVAHTRIHTRETPYSCSICGANFGHSSSLAAHLRRHRGEKPFACSFCKASFSCRTDLIIHVRTHTGEKPFSCSVCGKRFARKHQTQHMRTHTGEKPFNCSVCGKRFAQNATLARHLKAHTGEKTFCCSVCGKSFAHSQSLKQHSTVHTGEKPFSCEICDKRFTRLQNVKKHKCIVVKGGKDK